MRYLQAEHLFSGTDFLPEASVLVLDDNGQLQEIISQEQVQASEIERVEGILCPGFVNAHCHLELSHLKDQIPQTTGLPAFAMEVVKQRGRFSKERQTEAMQAADLAMWENGIVAVGDISNGSDSFEVKSKSSLYYHTFIELIGLHPKNASTIFNKGKDLLAELENFHQTGSLAPHAPYSTSLELIRQIAEWDATEKVPFSIHNQESLEEQKFFSGQTNGFDQLYAFLNLDISWYQAPGGTSIQNYGKLLNVETSILVHNTFTSKADIEALVNKKINWCLCPKANLYIEGSLPDYQLFLDQRICIGTDSLASNMSLDLVEEMNTILGHSKALQLTDLLRAVTSGGARALGIENQFGHLMPKRNTGLNLLQWQDSHLKFIKKIS